MTKMHRIWEILKEFKDSCKSCGWKTAENEDWIEIDGEYHSLLLARDISLSSFKKITTNQKCITFEGPTYRVVEASCTAWLFSETPSETLINMVLENPDFLNKVAIYDLSPICRGEDRCIRINHTESQAFKEFERFLEQDMKVKLEQVSTFFPRETSASDYTIQQLA
jgi:hypothetical protein